LIKNLQL